MNGIDGDPPNHDTTPAAEVAKLVEEARASWVTGKLADSEEPLRVLIGSNGIA
jgi:hypothetical protein